MWLYKHCQPAAFRGFTVVLFASSSQQCTIISTGYWSMVHVVCFIIFVHHNVKKKMPRKHKTFSELDLIHLRFSPAFNCWYSLYSDLLT